MVSLYPSPVDKDFFKPTMKMGIFPGHNSVSSVTDTVCAPLVDDTSLHFGSEDPGGKKIRKPYTITKSRETWTDQEHDKFIEALHLYVLISLSFSLSVKYFFTGVCFAYSRGLGGYLNLGLLYKVSLF